MKKFLTILFVMLFINNLSYAEIIQQKNDFGETNITMSIFEKDVFSFSENMPKEISFKKLNVPKTDPLYIIIFKTRFVSKELYVDLEPVKMKVNNDINEIYYIFPHINDHGERWRLSLSLSSNIVNAIKKADSLDFQIPIYTTDKIQVKYTEYTLPKPVLDEWKQVIAME